MQFNGVQAPAKVSLDFKIWTITIVAQVGDPTTPIASPAIFLSPDRPYRSFVYLRDSGAPSTVTVQVQVSADGNTWVNLATLTSNAEQTWISPTPYARLVVTLPSSPTADYIVGVVGIVIATV